MEQIGRTVSKKLSENEFLYEWNFSLNNFNKSYRSEWCSFLPYKNISGCQFVIVPDDDMQDVIKFLLFLYGCKERSRSKITYSASFSSKFDSKINLGCSDMCLDLEACMEIFEIRSSHPILFNTSEYIFKLELKLLEHITFASSFLNRNVSVQDLKDNSASSNPINEEPKNAPGGDLEYPKELIQDLRSLHTSGYMCDLDIHIGNDILHAHKLMLCARSNVFKKMMDHEFVESSSNSINITDCPAPPFEKFLKYLYTGEIEIGNRTMETIMPLYSLGDKYDVPALQRACSNILLSKLSSETIDDVANIVCDVLQLAERHSDTKLKKFAASFIVNHFPMVSNKQSWKDLMKSNFELTSEILTSVAAGLSMQAQVK